MREGTSQRPLADYSQAMGSDAADAAIADGDASSCVHVRVCVDGMMWAPLELLYVHIASTVTTTTAAATVTAE